MASAGNPQQQLQLAEQMQGQLDQLEQQYQQVSEYLEDLTSTRQAIEQIGQQAPGERVLLPIGAGAFVHAELAETDAVIAPLGNGVMAEEAPEKATKRIQARIDEAEEARESLEGSMDRLGTQLEQLVGQLRQGQAPQAQPGPEDQADEA